MSRARGRDLGDVLFAISDPTRREVVTLLARAPRRASDLAEEVGASRPAMSRHLRILRGAGVTREEADADDGRARSIALDPRAFDGVRAWLDDLDGFWSDQLASFKALAEARAAERKAAAQHPAKQPKRRAG